MTDNRPYQKRWRDKNKTKIASYGKAWRKRNPDKSRLYGKKRKPENRRKANRRRRLRQYGLTTEQYNEMLKAQDFRCASCGEQFRFFGKPVAGSADPQIDHCHITLIIRGILCGPCNISLGLMKENPTAIQKLAEYAEKYCSSRAEPLARHGRTVVPPPTYGDLE